jgi:hypothetical protein
MTGEQWRFMATLIPVYPGGRRKSMLDVCNAVF